MHNPFRREDPALDVALEQVYSTLKNCDPSSEAYSEAADQLVKLYTLKNKGVDPNTLATISANLLVAVAVLKFEQASVITSKVFSFITKK